MTALRILATLAMVSCSHAPDPSKPIPEEPDASLPTDADRHRLADMSCPAITRPFFYRLEKAGSSPVVIIR